MFIEKNYILFFLLNIGMFMVIVGVMLFVAKRRGVKAEYVETSQAKKRFVSQIVFHVVMFLIFILPVHVTMFFVSFAIIMCTKEWYGVVQRVNRKGERRGLFVISLCYLPLYPVILTYCPGLSVGFMVSFLLLNLVFLVLTQDIASPSLKLSTALILILFSYIFSHFIWLRQQENGIALCLFVVFVVHWSDSSAFVFGKIWGKRKLLSLLSPGKTVEGAVGSCIMTMGVAVLFDFVLNLKFSVVEALCIGVIMNVLAQLGDLFLSLFKRESGIKDYGKLLPGQGGFLDRFDSMILALPLFDYFIRYTH